MAPNQAFWIRVCVSHNSRQIYAYVSRHRHQKGQTNLDFNEARGDEVAVASAGLLDHRPINCASLQPRQLTTPAPPRHSIFTGWMLFPTPNQQSGPDLV